MAAKKPATNEEFEDMFAQIGGGENAASGRAPKPDQPTAPTSTDADDDPLADLKSQLHVPSRSSTPRVSSSATSIQKNTPTSSNSGRSSEEKAGMVAESDDKSFRAHPTTTIPSNQIGSKSAADDGSKGSGWWGGFSGLSSFASSAVKQAQGAVEQLQKNEDAQKWVEQARGNVGLLKGLGKGAGLLMTAQRDSSTNNFTGDDLRSRALPTFTNILHTLAPPISQHERLQIHITHDVVGYPSLDPLIYQSFSRVMAQVEGGDLLVIQRGSESAQRRPSEVGYTGSSSGGWADGAWWRSSDSKRNLGAVQGLIEGTKLARASAEAYAHEFYTSRGGLEEAMKQATAVISESNPTRSSDIFVSIQPISHTASIDLFAASKSSEEQSEGDKIVKDESQKPDQLVSFAIYLHDPVHTINYSGISQAIPQRWAEWMDAESTGSVHDGTQFVPQLPDEIQEIINSGGK